MEQELYRHVPYDIDIEQALLGAIFVDNKAIERVSAVLRPDHFYDPLHQRLYEAIVASFERGGIIVTPLTLHAQMKADPGLIEVGGLTYLANLAAAAPALPNVRDYAHILHDLWVRRALINIGETIVNTAYEAPLEKPPATQISEAEKALYGISETSRYGDGPLDFAASLKLAVDAAADAQERGGKISGVSSGFADIDSLLGGLQASDLLILAGRPGMGKTALATNIAFNAARLHAQDTADGARSRGAPVLFFSLEMAAQQLAARILSEQTEIEMSKIRSGRFSESEWERFVLKMQDLSTIPLYIDDTGGISIAQIAARARRFNREKGVGLIVIDYLQLIEPTRRVESRVQEITEITKGLKTLAKELKVPVLALSQLSRGVDSRDDKRPVLSDLRESGSIEQDADVVMFVFRQAYYEKSRKPDESDPKFEEWAEKWARVEHIADLLVEKHRHGPTTKLDLFFDDRFTRFKDLSERAM